MELVRDKDNYSSTYDFIMNQLLNYDYNDDESLKKLKMKISSLDAEITQEESLGLELKAQTPYYPGQYVIITDDIGPKLLQCTTFHYSGIYNAVPFPSPKPFTIKTQYVGNKTINKDIFNGALNDWLSVSYTQYGDVIIYQDYMYLTTSDFISGTEFDIIDWTPIIPKEFEFDVEYYVNDVIKYKNSYYIVTAIHNALESPIVQPAYFPSMFTEIGPAPLWETSLATVVNHYDSVLNELSLLEEYTAAVDASDMGLWETVKENRELNIINFISQISRVTGFQNKDYNIGFDKRPPLVTDVQFEALRLAYETKVINNELGSIQDIIAKPGTQDSTSKNTKSEISSVASSIPPALIEPGLRKTGIKELADEEPRERFSDDTYDEMHDLVYSLLCPGATTRDELNFAKGWRPNHDYKVGDIINTFTISPITSNYDITLIDNSDQWDTWGDYGDIGHIWICKTDHNSGDVYPKFDVGLLGQPPTSTATANPQVKIWIDPDIGSPTYEDTLWVRPMYSSPTATPVFTPLVILNSDSEYPNIQWTMTAEAPDADSAPEEYPFFEYGILPLVFYHHNPTAIPDDLTHKNDEYLACSSEDIGGLLKEEYTYLVNDPKFIDSEGDPLGMTLVQWEGLLFKVTTEFDTIPCPLTYDPVSRIVANLSNITYIGNCRCIKSENRLSIPDLFPLRGDDPPPERWWGIAFASQRNYIGYQNPCCCGNIPAGEDPEPIPILRRLHDLVLCQDCGFEYDDWGTLVCPVCGGVAVYSRWSGNTPPNPEKGRIIIAQSCGRESFNYNSNVSQAQFGQACYDIGLSPTNGCFHTAGSGVSDCMPCYGIWRLTPEQQNTPIDDLSLSYKKRQYINLIHTGTVADMEWPTVGGALDGTHGPTSIGDYYGTPEECFEAVSIVRYIAGAVEIVKNFNHFVDGTPDKDDLTFDRFVVLNRRLRMNRQIINNKIIAIGDKQIGVVLNCVIVPNFKADFIQKVEDQKNQKFNMGDYLKENTPEWN